MKGTVYPISQFPTLNFVTKVSSGNRLKWEIEDGMGYLIFRKVDDGEFINIKKIDNNKTTGWVDTDVDSDKHYSYYIKAYTTDGVQEYYSSEFNIKISRKPSEPSDIQNDNKINPKAEMKIGSKIMDKKTKAVYKMTRVGKQKTVEYVKCIKKNIASATIPASVKLKGKTYNVTSIGKGAFRNSKKLNKIKIGKNVKSIGKQAFYRCKYLRYFSIKTKKLTAKNVGKNAFAGGHKSPWVKIDKSVKKRYYRYFTLRGLSKKAKFISTV